MSRRNVVPLAPHADAPTPPDYMVRALLPWEDEGEFRTLRLELMQEHNPKGQTETELVAQLAWIAWRRRRLLLGERASHMAAIAERQAADHTQRQTIARALVATDQKGQKEELSAAVATVASDDCDTIIDTDEDEAMTKRAVAILETGDPEGYAEALAALREDTQDWWEDTVSDDEVTHPDGQPQEGDKYLPYSRCAEQLLRFLKQHVLQVFTSTRGEVSRRPAIRLQAYGESLDPFRADKIFALDERLNRQFEKVLGMLLRLQELRSVTTGRPTQAPSSSASSASRGRN